MEGVARVPRLIIIETVPTSEAVSPELEAEEEAGGAGSEREP